MERYELDRSAGAKMRFSMEWKNSKFYARIK